MNKNENKAVEIDVEANENDAAKTAENENTNSWSWKLSNPVTYNGEEISELKFDFSKITGRDAREIEDELQRCGKLTLYSQVSNIHYIMRVAAKACEKPIGIDLFDIVSINDYNALRTHAQLFLLNVAQ